ncbi:MAG TPA: hypothetical protein DHV24_03815 [Candidatus Margulisbacteria bacterium]|nr:hypothetical protein [Candidatus Margulisiibacteriota bacterium]
MKLINKVGLAIVALMIVVMASGCNSGSTFNSKVNNDSSKKTPSSITSSSDSSKISNKGAQLVNDNLFGIHLGMSKNEFLQIKDNLNKTLKFNREIVFDGKNASYYKSYIGANIYTWKEPNMEVVVLNDKVLDITLSLDNIIKYSNDLLVGKFAQYHNIDIAAIKQVYGEPDYENTIGDVTAYQYYNYSGQGQHGDAYFYICKDSSKSHLNIRASGPKA